MPSSRMRKIAKAIDKAPKVIAAITTEFDSAYKPIAKNNQPTRDQGLRRSPTRRRAFQARCHSSSEALPCQRGLHADHAAPQGNQRHANRRLTNRRASDADP